MKFLSCEKISEHKYKTPEGYLICVDSILARTGKQTYKRREVFGVDCKDAEVEIDVDRTPEEVFSDKTLASFENKPLTVEHPDEDVNVENHNSLSVGFVRDIKRGKTKDGEDVMLGTLVITDADTIAEIEDGEHTDLSCGYDCDIVDEANPCQRNIRGNHVALCQQGRAGIARIVDSYGGTKHLDKVTNLFDRNNIDWNSADNETGIIWFESNDACEKAEKLLRSKGFNFKSKFNAKGKKIVELLDSAKDSWDEDDDDLSNEEKELCDYMLKNVYEKGMSPEKLLDKMSSYYSMYQRLARHKPEDVKEYFREKIRTGYYDSVKDAKEYVFNWRDTYHGSRDKTRVEANSIKEAIKQFHDIIALGGIGTANCYIISISPNDGHMRAYGKLSELVKEFKDSVDDSDSSRIAMANAEIDRLIKKKVELNKEWNTQARIGNKYNCSQIDKEIDEIDKKIAEYKKLAYRDSIKDGLREPTQSELKKFEDYLIQRHWHVKKLGVTWTGRIHYEVSKLLQAGDSDRLVINEIEAAEDYSGLDMTYSIGSTGKELKGVVDIDKVYVRDSMKDAWSGSIDGYIFKYESKSDSYMITSPNGKTYKVKAGNLKPEEAIHKVKLIAKDSVKDDRLAPMTYKKLNELGVSKETYSKWSQEQANKYIAAKSKVEKAKSKVEEKEKSSKKTSMSSYLLEAKDRIKEALDNNDDHVELELPKNIDHDKFFSKLDDLAYDEEFRYDIEEKSNYDDGRYYYIAIRRR